MLAFVKVRVDITLLRQRPERLALSQEGAQLLCPSVPRSGSDR